MSEAERWQRLKALLDAAAEAPEPDRAARVEELCGGDRELLREVLELLSFEQRVDSFLAAPAVPSLRWEPEERPAGFRLGPYRCLELIDRGGMGTVYRAVREDDFEKEVAIKLVQLGLESPAVVRRFHAERQILARLEHPAIARLLDGGTADDGRPYLVMEHVEGLAIDRFCEEQGLGIAARLRLFLEVCAAVEVAHRNLVVHRDLKPANVLVTAEGRPKLLDFGIAKLLDPDPDLERGAPLTSPCESPMTPLYASPEQVREEPITTSSDVFSLGVLLFELLTGRLPCGLQSCPRAEIPRRICEREAEAPSGVRPAAGRTAGRGKIGRDLDAIVLTALRKEPEERYPSVTAFAADLQRHLEGLPVGARHGNAFYRASKLLRRRWRPLTAALLLVLTAGALTVRELRRLEGERQRSEKIAGFLTTLVDAADPDELGASLVTPGALLDHQRRRLDELRGEPGLYVELAGTLGRLYHKLGRFEEAGELLESSLRTYRELHPEPSPEAALRLNNLGMIHLERDEWGPAEALFREALEMRRRLGQGGSPETVANLSNLATVLLYRGAYEEAEALYRRGLEIRTQAHGPSSVYRSYSLRNLGALRYAAGKLEAAEPLLREALELRLEAYGEEDTRVASVQRLLGDVRAGLGDLVEAEALYLRALEIQRQRLGSEHLQVAISERQLAALLLAEGELATVRVLLPRALQVLGGARGRDAWSVAVAESLLGALYLAEGRRALAEPCLLESYRALAETRGEHSTYAREARERLLELEKEWPAKQSG